MTHTLHQILDFPTATGVLEVHVCACGQMFDAARFGAHVGQVAA